MIKHQILVLLPILPMFSVLSADYGQSTFAPDFDPWTHVDVFSRSLTYKSLSLSYNVVKTGPGPKILVRDQKWVLYELKHQSLLLYSENQQFKFQVHSKGKGPVVVELARLLLHSWRKRQCSDLRTKYTYVIVYSSNCIFCWFFISISLMLSCIYSLSSSVDFLIPVLFWKGLLPKESPHIYSENSVFWV